MNKPRPFFQGMPRGALPLFFASLVLTFIFAWLGLRWLRPGPAFFWVLGGALVFFSLLLGGGLYGLFSAQVLSPLQKLFEENQSYLENLSGNTPLVESENLPQGMLADLIQSRDHFFQEIHRYRDQQDRLINSIQEAIILFDLHGRIFKVNFAASMLLSRSFAELYHQGIEILLPPWALEQLAFWWSSRRFNEPARESFFQSKQGEVIPVLLDAAFLIDGLGRATSILVTARDLTLQKRQEERIRLLSEVVRQSPLAMMLCSPKGKPEYANPAFLRQYGFQTEEEVLEFKKLDQLVPGLGSVQEKLEAGALGAMNWQGEVLRHKQELPCWEQVRVSPLINQMGQIRQILVSLADVTQEKFMAYALQEANEDLEKKVKERVRELENAHASLEKAYKKLKSLDHLKDEFLATVSHELRTPLSNVLGYAEALVDLGLPPEQVKKFGGIILAESERLLLLINDLLDHSALISGRLRMNFATHCLDALVQQAIQAVSGGLKEKQIELIYQPSEASLWVDGPRLVQVLVNLLGNAVKFSPQAGQIKMEVVKQKKHLQIGMIDQGPGVPPDQVQEVFESFYQYLPEDHEIQGTGLGLAICKKIIFAHGGEIWARPGPGGRFFIQLPWEETT